MFSHMSTFAHTKIDEYVFKHDIPFLILTSLAATTNTTNCGESSLLATICHVVLKKEIESCATVEAAGETRLREKLT